MFHWGYLFSALYREKNNPSEYDPSEITKQKSCFSRFSGPGSREKNDAEAVAKPAYTRMMFTAIGGHWAQHNRQVYHQTRIWRPSVVTDDLIMKSSISWCHWGPTTLQSIFDHEMFAFVVSIVGRRP